MNTYIIAEAGVNHNGSMELAYRLIDAAICAGADAVKFQLFNPKKLVSADQKSAAYQKQNAGANDQLSMLEALELNCRQQLELKAYAEQKGIDFLTSPFDMDSLTDCLSMGLKYIKIPSGELLNIPMLNIIARHHTKVILSTGMATMSEIEIAMGALLSGGALTANDITILHCNTEYPTPMCDVNLKAMQTIQDAFKTGVGYSDHTLGIEIPIAAVALGATIIEKHFTLDKTMQGPDHKASLSPDELSAMVKAIRHIEQALGNGIKTPSLSEEKNKDIVRKRILASMPIKKGTVFSEQNLILKRAPIGLFSEHWPTLIGRAASKDFAEGEGIIL